MIANAGVASVASTIFVRIALGTLLERFGPVTWQEDPLPQLANLRIMAKRSAPPKKQPSPNPKPKITAMVPPLPEVNVQCGLMLPQCTVCSQFVARNRLPVEVCPALKGSCKPTSSTKRKREWKLFREAASKATRRTPLRKTKKTTVAKNPGCHAS